MNDYRPTVVRKMILEVLAERAYATREELERRARDAALDWTQIRYALRYLELKGRIVSVGPVNQGRERVKLWRLALVHTCEPPPTKATR